MAVTDDALPREPPPDIIAPPLAPGAGRWGRFRQAFVDNYLTVDARSLGLGRIVLATVLLVDLIRRIPDISLFYSNDGLVPNHMMLWRPPTQWMFSFFFMLSRPDEVAVAFVICGLIYFGLLLGWRTRFMHVLALIAVLSLHGRVTLMENGGDWMLGELTFWSVFLPLGRAVLRRRRAGKPASPPGADRRRAGRSGGLSAPDPRGDGRWSASPSWRLMLRSLQRLPVQRRPQGRPHLAARDGGSLRPPPGPHGDLVRRLDAPAHEPLAVAPVFLERARDRGVLPILMLSPSKRSWTRRRRRPWPSSACTPGFSASSIWGSFPGR